MRNVHQVRDSELDQSPVIYDSDFPRNELLFIYYVLYVGGNYVKSLLYPYEPLDL